MIDYMDEAERGSAVAREHLIGAGAVAELEKKIAAHYGARHALCVSSATAGLLAIALAIGLRDSEFITSPFTFGGSLASWLLLGNRSVFVDIEPRMLTLDPDRVREAVTATTRAVLGIDALGNPSDTVGLSWVARENGLWYIADAAAGFGATRDGKPGSHLADAIVLSFTDGKTLSCGEGGAVVTNNSDLYERLLWFSQHGSRQKHELGLGVVNEFAFNARIHPLAAVWANAKFERSLEDLGRHQARCHKAISLLNESGLTGYIDLDSEDIRPAFFCLSVELKEKVTATDVVDWLKPQGVQATWLALPAGVIYKNPAFTEQFADRYSIPNPCIVAERAAKRIALVFETDFAGEDL